MEEDYVVVVPVKPPAQGKTRLGAGLQADADSIAAIGRAGDRRSDLAAAFAMDAVTAAMAAAQVAAVLVTTDDPRFAARCAQLGCATMPDGSASGLNAALVQAAAEAARRWPGLAIAAMCADLPALIPHDLEAALAQVRPGRRPAYCVDADSTGTTLYVASYTDFDPRFGHDSSAAHRAGGATALVGDLSTLRRDVDDLTALDAAVELGVGSWTQAALSAHGR